MVVPAALKSLLLLQALLLLPLRLVPTCTALAFSPPLLERTIREKLERITSGYKTHMDSMIRTLEMEIELSTKVEKCLLLSTATSSSRRHNDGIEQQSSQHNSKLLSEKYRRKRSLMEECLNSNYHAVQQLLLGVTNDEMTRTNLLQRVTFAPSEGGGDDNGDDITTLLGNGGMATEDNHLQRKQRGMIQQSR